MPIRVLTFDLDDTLWEVTPILEKAEEATHRWLAQHYPRLAQRFDVAALRALRLELAEQEATLRHNLSELRKRSFREAARRVGYPPELANAAFSVFIHHRNQVTLFEDVLPALENLAQRFVLGAITNGNACIHRTGLDHVLGFSVAAADVGAAKPDAAIFREACRRCQVKSHEIVHIGDDPACDVAGAAAAGLRTVWVNRSGQAWTGKQRPDAEIHDLRELEDVLPRL